MLALPSCSTAVPLGREVATGWTSAASMACKVRCCWPLTCGALAVCIPAGLELTFHRAFDLVKDQRAALNDLVACRVRRVLSSGGAGAAWSHFCWGKKHSRHVAQCYLTGLPLIPQTASPASFSSQPGGPSCQAELCTVCPLCCAGGQQTVMEGLSALAQLVAEGGSRISVMPGGGLTEENAATVARVSGEIFRPALCMWLII